nr:xylulose kinase-1 [Tanacetum cinerariifolium]
MSTLNFGEVHNMIAFLLKPTKSAGFEQIIDFLNAHPIKYVLTVNPTIYNSCVEQFWGTATVKNINGEAQLHAKVDGKKVVIFEVSIRRELPFRDKGEESQEAGRKSRTHGLKRLYKVRLSARVESFSNEESLDEEDSSKQGRISDIDSNQDIYLVNVHRDIDIFGVNDQDDTSMFDADKDLQGEEVVVEEVNVASITTHVSVAAAITPTISLDEITLAKSLIEIKTSRPNANGLVMQELSKGIMVEEPLKMKKKDHILFDEELARKLQKEIYKQERLAKVDDDYQSAERLHAKEQEQFTDAEEAKLFMEFIEKTIKLFAAKRDEEKRKKPPTKAQQRK